MNRRLLWSLLFLAIATMAVTLVWMILDYSRIVYGLTVTFAGLLAILVLSLHLNDFDDDRPDWGARP